MPDSLPPDSNHQQERQRQADAEEMRLRLRLLQLGDDDRQRLNELAPRFQAAASRFVEGFYEFLNSMPEASGFLQDQQRLERMKQAQRAHFESLFAAVWDAEFVAHRRRVGQTHADVSIEPQLFLSAYQQYVQFCLRLLAESQQENSDAWRQAMSMLKVIFLDIGLTLDSYFTQSTRALRHALDMYWRTNSELRQFAQLASHDLKTPLATVANLCDEVLDEFGKELPGPARDMIQSARDRTLRMGTMIDELLSTALSPQSAENCEEISSGACIEEAVERLRPVLDARRIELRLPASYPFVWGNRVRLREAFYNLLANAAKFIDKAPGRIEVLVNSESEHALFTVRDNGPGIPVEGLQRIFVPFHRLPEHRHLPGSGLGLYFTLNLIEQQGGRIWVESQLGEGSSFHVQLRRKPT